MRGAASIESAVELHAPGSLKVKPNLHRNVARENILLQVIEVVELVHEGNQG